MIYECIKYEISERIALVTINRPEKLNALNIKTLDELYDAFKEINNNTEINCVIITGAGEKAFVAGADINEISLLNENNAIQFAKYGQEVFNYIETFGKPVIAAVNGYALGGGCELALACHIRYASINAKFGQPEINLGLIPGYGGTLRLPKIINNNRAIEMILTGELIDADESYRIGLINKIYSLTELLPKSFELAKKISLKSNISVKNAITAVFNNTNENGFSKEAELFGNCCNSKDFIEGTTAFIEKRKPVFINQ